MKRRLASLALAGVGIAEAGGRLLAIGSGVWRRSWRWVRALTGEDAYERYLAHLQSVHPGREPMSLSAFYRQREAQKWDGIKRCC